MRRLQVARKELDLVADQCLEGVADVEIEVAHGVHLDLPRGAVVAYRRVWAAGVTVSNRLTQKRIGMATFFAARPGR